DALNIDRDSFNKFHPEFRTLQEYLHDVLHKNIFPAVYKNIDKRSATKAESKGLAHKEHLQNIIIEATDSKVKVKETRKPQEDQHLPQVAIQEKENRVEVLLPSPEDIKVKKSNRQLAAAILAIYEISARERTHDKQREMFTELLLKLLSGW